MNTYLTRKNQRQDASLYVQHFPIPRFAVAAVQELPYGVDANTFATELLGNTITMTLLFA